MQTVLNFSTVPTGTRDMDSHGGPWEPEVCSLRVDGYLVPTLPLPTFMRGNADSA